MEPTFVALNTRLVLLDEDFNLTFITRHDPRLCVFDKNLGPEIILIYYFTDLLFFALSFSNYFKVVVACLFTFKNELGELNLSLASSCSIKSQPTAVLCAPNIRS